MAYILKHKLRFCRLTLTMEWKKKSLIKLLAFFLEDLIQFSFN